MPWPPTLPTAGQGFIDQGYSTIVWGTDWSAGSPTFNNFFIVKSVRPAQRVEEVPIMSGIGLTASEILLHDGYNYEVTVVDNTAVTLPSAGYWASLQTPFSATPFDFLLINNDYNAARKQEGERVLLCKSFTLFNNGTAGPVFPANYPIAGTPATPGP